VACVGNVTDPDFGDRFVKTALDSFGDIDIIIVNNAGYTWDSVIQKTTDEQWYAMIDVHMTAPFRILRGGEELEKLLVSAIDATPADTGPLATLLAAFARAPEVSRPREFLAERSAVIAANAPLQERELIKLVSMSEAVTAALVRRGCDEQAARLTTDVAMAVVRLTTDRCMADERADFAETLAATTANLRAICAPDIATG
jgi:hypothetical protein